MTEIGGSVSCGDWYVSWDNATSEESMVNNIVQRGALLRVGCENLLHKLARIERDIPVEWEFVLIIADAPEKGTSSGCKHP
jgi:hypothetical protein